MSSYGRRFLRVLESSPCISHNCSRMTDGQSASLSSCHHSSWAHDHILLTGRQLRVCWWGRHLCSLQLLLGLNERSSSRTSPAGLNSRFYFLKFDTPQHGLPGPPLFYVFPRNFVAQLYSEALGRNLSKQFSHLYALGMDRQKVLFLCSIVANVAVAAIA
jgi:hypothetical protein